MRREQELIKDYLAYLGMVSGEGFRKVRTACPNAIMGRQFLRKFCRCRCLTRSDCAGFEEKLASSKITWYQTSNAFLPLLLLELLMPLRYFIFICISTHSKAIPNTTSHEGFLQARHLHKIVHGRWRAVAG